ncbi:MAG: UDP-N-acetylmuramate dehydrogenase [Candidatus Neomarinimicrobiota bacterium]
MNRQQQEALNSRVQKGRVLFNEPLSQHTTYGIGGPAEVFVQPYDRVELAQVLKFAHQEGIPVTCLGAGSNCLVSDTGLSGLVISLAGTLKNLHIEDGRVAAEAGVMLGHLVKRCLQAGLTGLESLIGIPGTLGGALVMNAGAFGAEISTHLDQVLILTLNGEEKVYQSENLQFGYRSSSFRPDEIIVEAEFHFAMGTAEAISRTRKLASNERKARQPLKYRSAGSVFKNPSPDMAAGMLIDRAGLKGTRRGEAEISTQHGNFFINRGAATAGDMAFLIKLAARTIKQRFNTQLEFEIKTFGFQPGYWEDAGLAQS